MFSEKLIAPALGPLLLRPARLRVAWDVLRHAACSDCSLGTSGLRDDVLPGTHLCGRRLRRLAGELADPIAPGLLDDVSAWASRSAPALRSLGRLAEPMLRRAGAPGFAPIAWEDAANLARARLRDARLGATSSLFVHPEGLHLETLFQLRRFAQAIERRQRDSGVPGPVQLIVSDAERALRVRARGRAGRGRRTFAELEPGDVVAVVATAQGHPLLPEVLEALRAHGVLVERVEPESVWPSDVRETIVLGESGVLAALSVGLPLADVGPSASAIAKLDAAYVVGACPSQELAAALVRVPARIHQATHLDPAMLVDPTEFVLLLPSNAAHEHPGGGTFLSDDGRLRFGPEVLGHEIPGPRPHWTIPLLALGLIDPDRARDLAVHDAAELRAAMALSIPALADLAGFGIAGDSGALRPSG